MTHTDGMCGCECAAAAARIPAAGAAPTPAGAQAGLSRRTVLTGSVAVVAGLGLAACSNGADTTRSTPTPTRTPTSGQASGGSTGERLASTADLAVGGGVVVTASVGPVVVTHPTASEYKAFNGRCPHAGCPVGSVANGTISCPCHGSTFDATTGDRTGGPAPTGLTPLEITVKDDAVYLT